ncbi:MAG: thiamine-phosphate kinase [Sphingomonadaceae bacterium]
MNETDFLALLRPLATHPAARGLRDDAAVLGDLVVTHDMLVEGVHFRAADAANDVAWKLIAVNLSDLAAKGAVPVGVLLGYTLGEDTWDAAFVRGLEDVLSAFDVPLLGGDTVRGPRVLSLTALGRSVHAPSRSGARAGDALWVTGVIGRTGLGLQRLGENRSQDLGDEAYISAYLRPTPRLAEGQALAPLVTAMMDVSDGLLIDAQRMADASEVALFIDLDAVPHVGERMAAMTAGDDYELLFALPPDVIPPVAATRIGAFADGQGLMLRDANGSVALPTRLGWLHL